MNRKKLVTAVLAVVLVVVGAATLLAPGAESLPSQEVTTIYYSSPAKTTIVGIKILSCFGGTVQDGTTSAYYDRFQEPCF
jgi:drug/metabolite transporter (DMT)-like permease